jgi:hypothetical protein
MDFILGVKALETKNFDLYKRKLIDCVSYGVNSYLERSLYLARIELKKYSS